VQSEVVPALGVETLGFVQVIFGKFGFRIGEVKLDVTAIPFHEVGATAPEATAGSKVNR
jgi:hypothetical protein